MRTKTVVIVAGLGVALVAALIVVKGLGGGAEPLSTPGEDEGQISTNPPAPPPLTEVLVKPGTTNSAALPTSEGVPQRPNQKDFDEIREIVAAGSPGPLEMTSLVDKITHVDPEVRKSALEAIQQLNATNAVPRLREAMNHLDDPREKAAILNVIEFLELPDSLDVPVPGAPGNQNSPTRPTP